MRFWLHVNKFRPDADITNKHMARAQRGDATWDDPKCSDAQSRFVYINMFTFYQLCCKNIHSKWSTNSFCFHSNHFHKVYSKLVVCPLLCLFWGLFCRKKYSVLFVLDSFRFNFCPKLPSTLSPSLSKASILLFSPRIYSPFCLAELVLIFNSFPLVSLPASFIILYTDFVKFK